MTINQQNDSFMTLKNVLMVAVAALLLQGCSGKSMELSVPSANQVRAQVKIYPGGDELPWTHLCVTAYGLVLDLDLSR